MNHEWSMMRVVFCAVSLYLEYQNLAFPPTFLLPLSV